MSSIVMHARDLVQAFKGETRSLEDRNVDERDMTRQQLETLAAGFGRVADLASRHRARLLERIQAIDSTADPFKKCGVVDDIRDCRDGLISMRADYVQAFAAGENGPYAWKELSQLQSIIMAFDAVIDEADRLGASEAPEGKLDAAIDDVKRVTAVRKAGLI